MLDLVKLKLLSGDGGDGNISLHREKFVPKGGPDGGNGGRGGSIIFKGDGNLNSFLHLNNVQTIQAKSGQKGGKNNRYGKSAFDIIIKVPLGTVFWLLKENSISSRRRKLIFEAGSLLKKSQVNFFKYFINGGNEDCLDDLKNDDKLVPIVEFKNENFDFKIQNEEIKKYTKVKIAEIIYENQEIVVCQGGFGGRGNTFFKSSKKTTPLEAEKGSLGEKKEVVLELKLLADVGLVGFPNAGKSTLLSRLTYSKPKIGNYRFTTLEPNLGILSKKKFDLRGGFDIVIADLPGLIEKSSLGKGLGFDFLRHLSHCNLLLFILSLDENELVDENLSISQKVDLLQNKLVQLRKEICFYDKELLKKKYAIVINKIDLYEIFFLKEIRRKFTQKNKLKEIFYISNFSLVGLEELAISLINLVNFKK